MLFDFEVGIVTDYVESFEMIGKKDFEIWIMGIIVKCHVYVVIISAGVRGIFYFEVLNKNEILDDFDGFYFTVFAKEIMHEGFVRVLHSADVEFTDQDAFVNFFRRLGLLC